MLQGAEAIGFLCGFWPHDCETPLQGLPQASYDACFREELQHNPTNGLPAPELLCAAREHAYLGIPRSG